MGIVGKTYFMRRSERDAMHARGSAHLRNELANWRAEQAIVYLVHEDPRDGPRIKIYDYS